MDTQKCGTVAGYGMHLKWGTPTCAQCRKAKTQRDAQYLRDNPDKRQAMRNGLYAAQMGLSAAELRDRVSLLSSQAERALERKMAKEGL